MKNIDYVNKRVAEKLGIEESKVKKINRHLWKNFSKQIHAHEETTIYLRGLGTFTHSIVKMREEISHLVRMIRGIRKSNKFTPPVKERIENQHVTYLRKLLGHKNKLVTYSQERMQDKIKYKNEQNT